MKIGVLIDRLNVGGVEKIAIEEVKALRDLDANAILVVLSRKAVVKDAFKDILQGVPIVYLDDRLPRLLKFSFKIPFFYFFSFFHLSYPFLLPFVVKKKEFDFIVSHNTYTSFTALTLSKFKKIPYAIYVWDPISYILSKAYTKGPIRKLSFVLNGIAKIADEVIMGNAEFVLVSGDAHEKFIKALLHKVRIVFLSPGHAALPKIPSQRGSYIFAATAWKEGKGIEDLLKIVANIKEINLKIAGRWIHESYRKRIVSIVTRMGLTKRVAILGEVSEKELNKYYSGARVAIGVNNERGFGLVALEAASNGCPFIITKDSGATKYFKGDVDGFYYDYGDLNSLENYMQKLITDERLAYNMGKHAWETVRNKYTWQKHAQNLLQEILKT